MPKSRPIEVHVNSRGRKYLKLQQLLHSDDEHVFLPVDAKLKTDLFNKGFLDGRKRPIQMQPSYDTSNEETFVLAIDKGAVQKNMDGQFRFFGLVPLEKTYLIQVHEADQFLKNVCMDCEFHGESNCFKNEFTCGKEDRDHFRDSPHFETLKEIRGERKRQTFPIMG